MTELMQASNQWATRPSDERFINLTDLADHFNHVRSQSAAKVVSSRALNFEPTSDNKGLLVYGPNGVGFAPTHHAFNQLASLGGAPAGYLRTLASPLVADNLNYGFKFNRAAEDVGVLLRKNGSNILRAATGPNYGRVWNNDIIETMIKAFGNGRDGEWKVPGEFGEDVEITKANTTLYASDRDMFVFLADEKNRVDIPNRRGGKGAARGFFLWNSEEGDKTLGLCGFFFDYACCNRIVWGASGIKTITIRHTVSAPDRWLEEVMPILTAYSNGSSDAFEAGIRAAQAKKVEDVEAFLGTRFGKRLVSPMLAVHQLEEGRPVETLWDVATAATAYAKGVQWQDVRVDIERKAGAVLDLVAA